MKQEIKDDYTVMSKYHNREVRHYVFVLKNTEYTEKRVATTISLNASTELKLWLGDSGNVIGLDFIQVIETPITSTMESCDK